MGLGIVASDYDSLIKLHLVEAADRLLADTAFDKLTVSAICAEAATSRSTFYRHFDDKYGLVQWVWDIPASRCFAESEDRFDWHRDNLRMMEFAQKFPALFSAALAARDDYNSCINYGYRQRVAYLENLILTRNPSLLTEDIRFQISFFVRAESIVVGEWMRNGLKDPPERLARRIKQCVPDELRALVDRLI